MNSYHLKMYVSRDKLALPYFSSKSSFVHERRDEDSPSVANPVPLHLILPNISSRKIYLFGGNIHKKQVVKKIIL